MLPWTTYLILFCMGTWGFFILIEMMISRKFRNALIEGGILGIIVLLFYFTTGFPNPKYAFSATTPIGAISVMYVGILTGIIAHYLFYMRKFSLKSFLKPFFISPLILLPLIGTIQGISNFEIVQLISFFCISFQNGFFWKGQFERMLKHAKN